MYQEKILVVLDCDGVVVKRDYAKKCFEKFSNSKIIGKIASGVLKAYVEGKIPLSFNSFLYVFLPYCLKKTSIVEIEDYISKTIQFYLNPKISYVIKELKERGIKVGMVSENIQFLPKYLGKILGVDFVYSNEIRVKNGKITGEPCGRLRKSEMIDRIAKHFSIPHNKILYVGDDLDLFGKVKCVLFDPRRKNDKKKIDNKNCFFIKDIAQLLSLIENLYKL